MCCGLLGALWFRNESWEGFLAIMALKHLVCCVWLWHLFDLNQCATPTGKTSMIEHVGWSFKHCQAIEELPVARVTVIVPLRWKRDCKSTVKMISLEGRIYTWAFSWGHNWMWLGFLDGPRDATTVLVPNGENLKRLMVTLVIRSAAGPDTVPPPHAFWSAETASG